MEVRKLSLSQENKQQIYVQVEIIVVDGAVSILFDFHLCDWGSCSREGDLGAYPRSQLPSCLLAGLPTTAFPSWQAAMQ